MLFSLLLAALPQVSVDWSLVPDSVIARCHLSGLEAMVLQGMVDEGYAVVRSIPAGGIELVIRTDQDRFFIEGTRAGRAPSSRTVPIPTACDSTIQVEIIAGLREVSDALGVELESRSATVATTVTATQASEQEAAPQPVPSPAWRISGGLGAVLPSSTGMFALRASVRRRIEEVWFIGLALEGSVRPTDRVLVFEPVLAAQGVVQLWSSASGIAVLIGVEAGVLGHLFRRDGERGGHADGRFGLILEGRLPILGATLLVLPYLRLIPVRQEVGGQTAFEARHLGVVLALSVSFDL